MMQPAPVKEPMVYRTSALPTGFQLQRTILTMQRNSPNNIANTSNNARKLHPTDIFMLKGFDNVIQLYSTVDSKAYDSNEYTY